MSIIAQLEAAGEVLSPAVRAAIEGLETAVKTLQERVRELEARLAQNSTNSSKPPSSDPPGVSRPPRKPTGKGRGGQPGHRGHHRKRVEAERVDEVVVHRPESCGHCGHTLAEAEIAKADQAHQVVELPPVRAQVAEHRMQCLRCPKCRKLTRAKLPVEVAGKHFGPRLVGLVSLLCGRYRMSRRETVDLLGRLLDVPPPSLGSTEACVQETSRALAPVYEEVRAEVRRSPVAGVDETPWKKAGQKQWLWVATTPGATVFHLGAGRGADELRSFLEAFAGVVISDRWCAYQIYERRQLCWAHLLRNFKELALRGGKAAEFAEEGLAECARVFDLWRQVQDGQKSREQLRTAILRIRNRFRRLIRRGVESSDKKVASFCHNMQRLQRWLWTFVEEMAVEPTNNGAERALRPAVLWRKGCFGSQGETGLRYAERVLTFAATCRQQGVHPFDFLSRAVIALRTGTAAPRLLPAD